MIEPEPAVAQEPTPGVRLPLAKPVVTNVLLGLIVIGFLAEVLVSRSLNDITTAASITTGAQLNSLIVGGDYWRLLSAMFLHGGLMHLAFNGWALFSVGRDMESLLGSGLVHGDLSSVGPGRQRGVLPAGPERALARRVGRDLRADRRRDGLLPAQSVAVRQVRPPTPGQPGDHDRHQPGVRLHRAGHQQHRAPGRAADGVCFGLCHGAALPG